MFKSKHRACLILKRHSSFVYCRQIQSGTECPCWPFENLFLNFSQKVNKMTSNDNVNIFAYSLNSFLWFSALICMLFLYCFVKADLFLWWFDFLCNNFHGANLTFLFIWKNRTSLEMKSFLEVKNIQLTIHVKFPQSTQFVWLNNTIFLKKECILEKPLQ